jgi:CubicO group peptidase (beta-lactamase class C family)
MRLLLSVLLAAVPTLADEVDDYVRAEMARRRIPGLAVAVARDGRIVKQQAYGVANVELNVPVTPDTVFLLASMTKVFTSAAVLALVDDGKVALDDPIAKYVSGLPAAWAPVTVRHCLSHTSGLPDVVTPEEKIEFTTWEAALPALTTRSIQKPGAESSYNQAAYALLGMMIRRVTGMGFEEFVAARILKPLGMTRTSYGDQADLVPGRVTMYTAVEPADDRMGMRYRDGRPVISPDKIFPAWGYVYPRYLFTGAGLNSTIADLARWELALSSGRVVRPATLAEAAKPFRLNDGKDGEFGLGWMASDRNGHRVMQFGGGGATWQLRLPDDRLSVIVLTNLQGSSPMALAMGIAQIYLPDLKPRPQ